MQKKDATVDIINETLRVSEQPVINVKVLILYILHYTGWFEEGCIYKALKRLDGSTDEMLEDRFKAVCAFYNIHVPPQKRVSIYWPIVLPLNFNLRKELCEMECFGVKDAGENQWEIVRGTTQTTPWTRNDSKRKELDKIWDMILERTRSKVRL